jgi:hypothetical protein
MRSGLIGRLAVALLATCLLAGVLYWVFLRSDTQADNGTRAELNVTRLQNGPAPTQFDTGQTATISSSPLDPGANMSIRDGRLTFDPTKAGAVAAFYASPDMQGSITKLGARWVYEPRGNPTTGSISMIVSHGTTATPPAVLSPVAISLVVTPVNWNASLKKDDGSQPIPVAVGEFNPPLAVDGTTSYEASLSIDGSRLTINLPDGDRRNVNDARIAQWQGSYAVFGLYSNDGLTDSVGGFQEIWATSRKDDQ